MRLLKTSAVWLALLLLLTSCSSLAPGTDRLGNALQEQVSQTVIPAIEAYRQNKSEYPKSIHLLDVDLSWIPEEARLAYQRGAKRDYALALYYDPSGTMASRTQCLYQSQPAVWVCREWEQQ